MGWWDKANRILAGESDLLVTNMRFARLWGAQVLSQIAQNLLNFALIIQVFQLSQGTRFANFSVALLILSFGVPSIFFAAAAGVYVDHLNRKHVMVIANILRGLLVLLYLVLAHNLFLVLFLTFAISTITQFFAPAEAASIPMLVDTKHLLRANSLFIFTLNASFIVGYSLSAPVIALFGATGPYYLTSTMFLVATLLVITLPTLRASQAGKVKFFEIVKRTPREIISNWELIRSNRELSFPIFQLTVTQATVGVILALAPALSLALLREPLQNTSHVLIIPAGLGMVVGVVLVGQLAKRWTKNQLIRWGLMIGAISLMLLGLSGQLHRTFHGHEIATAAQIGLAVTVLLLILGFMNAVVSTAAQTMLQENTTDATRGKVFGALNMMVNIAATLPIFFAGILADLTSVTRVITLLGLILVAVALLQQYQNQRRNEPVKSAS